MNHRYDLVSLGEIMLRLDPGEGRVRTARTFRAWEGGGEYSVARGLRRCFGLRTAVVTAFADNEVGKLLEDLVLQGGVDTSFITGISSVNDRMLIMMDIESLMASPEMGLMDTAAVAAARPSTG